MSTVASGTLERVSALRWVLWISTLLVVLVGGRMVLGHRANRADVLLLPPDLVAGREQLRVRPQDEALKQQIRQADKALRQRYFRHLDANAWGAWLLVIAGAVAVLAARGVVEARRRPALPGQVVRQVKIHRSDAVKGRSAVAIVAGVTACTGIALVGLTSSRLPNTVNELQALLADAREAVLIPGPTREEWLAAWPMFRGPRGDGVASTTNAPMAWNGESGEGVVWKTEVPWTGHSSPVVWGDRVFLTGGNAEARHVMCWDIGRGALLWDRTVPTPPGGFREALEVPEETGFAASTAATDGRHICVMFATGELAAFDFGGTLAWSKPLGPPENMYGHAASLSVWKDLLLVQFDQGSAEDGKSRLYAIETGTGKVRWEQRRAVPSSWTTPLMIEDRNPPQVIAMAEPWIMGYDAASGSELWRADCLGSDLASSPIAAGDLLVAVSPGKQVVAFRLDGRGDVTETHQAWAFDELVPDIVSPLSDGGRVYLLTTPGDLFCVEAASGKKIWEHALDLEFNASPVLVGDRIYLLSTTGVTVVIEARGAFRELARAELKDKFHASPAVAGGRIYLRGARTLYCIGDTTGSVVAREKP